MGGAMLTGLREGVRVFHMLKGEDTFGKAAAALVDKDAVRKRKKVRHRAVAPRCSVLCKSVCAASRWAALKEALARVAGGGMLLSCSHAQTV